MAKKFCKSISNLFGSVTLILIPVGSSSYQMKSLITPTGVSGGIEDEIDILVDPNSPFLKAFADAKQKFNHWAVGVNDGLSDVLMLVSWDMDSNKVDLISIPRDTYYERDGYTSPSQKKINAAYASDKGVIATGEYGQRRSDGYSDQVLRDHRLRCGRIDCRRCRRSTDRCAKSDEI